jgi:predicted PhzF superfamily epimerase YddE/YHI9
MQEGFWENVREELVRLDKKQVWLTEKSGVKRTTINNGINRSTPEKPSNPHVDDAVKIAQALGTTVEYLVTGNPPAGLSPEALAIAMAIDRMSPAGREAAAAAISGLEKAYPLEGSGLSNRA